MTSMTRSGSRTVGSAGAPLRSPLTVGAIAAAQAVLGSLLCVMCPMVVVWIAASRTGSSWSEAVRVAADAWLLAHHTGIAVAGGHVSLVPVGLTLVPAAWCWTAGRRMATVLDLGGAGAARSGGRALAAFTGVYAAMAVVASLLAASPLARPLSGQALLGGGLLAFAVSGAAMWRAVPTRRLRLPGRLRAVLIAALVAVAAWTAAAALVVAGSLVAGWDGVLAAHRALDPGVLGGAALAAGQLAYLPSTVVWAAAWLAGPGFSVGVGTSVNPWFADVGALPAVPVLAGLPSGMLPGAVAGVVVVPVLCGALAGYWLHRRSPARTRGWRRVLLDGPACGALAGVAGSIMAGLASGSAGPGRLQEVGVDVLPFGAIFAGEVALGCTLTLAALTRWWSGRTDARPQMPQPAGVSSRGIRLRSSIRRS